MFLGVGEHAEWDGLEIEVELEVSFGGMLMKLVY